MKILLTNDDGYDSLGLIKVKNILSKYGEVYVIAPLRPQSAKSCAVGSHLGINVHKIDMPLVPTGYGVVVDID